MWLLPPWRKFIQNPTSEQEPTDRLGQNLVSWPHGDVVNSKKPPSPQTRREGRQEAGLRHAAAIAEPGDPPKPSMRPASRN